jgi:hypothetical protein
MAKDEYIGGLNILVNDQVIPAATVENRESNTELAEILP